MSIRRAFDLYTGWRALDEVARLFRRHRRLILEMTRRDISDQYAGQVLGTIWAIGHPLFLMALFVFIFAVVFKVRVESTHTLPLDYTVYILSGLVPWLGIQQSMVRSCSALTGQANLVKQVVFPVEVLPIKVVLSSCIAQVVGMAVILIYTAATARALMPSHALLPLLFALQLLVMTGLAFILSALSVFLRDIKDLIQLFVSAGIYLMPVVYVPDWVPTPLRPLLYLNPFSYIVWCYQDAMYFGRFEHPWAWLVFAAEGLVAFVVGYRLFRRMKPYFGNYL